MLRVAAAIALAEILARGSGVRGAATVRRNINDILREALSEPLRTEGAVMTDNGPILVEPIVEDGNGRWRPSVGPEALGFLENSVPQDARDAVCASAVDILGKGVPPTAETGQETGLIVGYVQSGKTMSFETVAALARDNAFPMVIVVTGSSKSAF